MMTTTGDLWSGDLRSQGDCSAVSGDILIEAEDSQPFVDVPARVLLDTELPLGARLLYGILVWLGWRQAARGEPGYAGQEALAEEFGMSPRSVRTYLKQLEAREYIRMEPVGGARPANIVILPLPEAPEDQDAQQPC